MYWEVTTQPAVEPVSLAEAKESLSIDDSIQDNDITRNITAARRYAEQYTNRAFITQTVTLTRNGFQADGNHFAISLPIMPVQAVTQLQYVDPYGATQIIDPADYGVVKDNGRHWLMPAIDAEWPDAYNRPDSVTITITAGYGNAGTDVPQDIRTAILLGVRHLTLNPEQFDQAITMMPMAIKNLLMPYKLVRL